MFSRFCHKNKYRSPTIRGRTGVLRRENVRESEVDRVVMQDCFRPGDVVRAYVMSLGSARSYELSTARSELGVASAAAKCRGEVPRRSLLAAPAAGANRTRMLLARRR